MQTKTILAVLLFILLPSFCYAKQIDIERLATAIYHAENSKAHPYGIMQKYKHTTPRMACINTINHRLKLWNGKDDFIVFLGKTYSPPDINPNWVRLVKYFYAKAKL